MRTTVCLNGEWDFMPLYSTPTALELPYQLAFEPQKVLVPSSWRSAYENVPGRKMGDIPEHDYRPYDLFGYPKEWEAAAAGVLHRTFTVPVEMEGQRIFLRLDGIMQQAAVYLDREQIAYWQDGYLPLRVEVTGKVKPGGEHRLHVVCSSFPKVKIPSGLEKVTGLTGSWFGYIARGIWQDVFLESQPVQAIEDVVVRTSVREKRLEVDASVTLPAGASVGAGSGAAAAGGRPVLRLAVKPAADAEAAVVLEAEAAEVEAVPNGATGIVRFSLDWADPMLWSPDQPFLYMLELELVWDGLVLDRQEIRFGFREVWTEGPRFILNGIPVNLRGDSWHFQGANQQTEAYVRTWYSMCKEAGVNSVRLHAEPYPAYYLDIADEMGMLIVDETAIYGSGKTMQADHPDYIENCRRHVELLVQRDKNHPSIIMWSVENEMRWVDGRDIFKTFIPEFMDIIRRLDVTRPIIVEGDNRLLPKELTEVETRHYNIDGIIDQWDRTVPLVFGEHGGWWYICPQNSSMYVGFDAYHHTDEAAKGLAEKERLFVEYARRQGVSGISTFNFAHYFMRAMPERDIPLPVPERLDTPGPKPKVIPRYSLSLNNGLLPAEYPAYRTNPSFAIMAASFKPATILAAEYNTSFFDDLPVRRSFDVFNDTLVTRDVEVACSIRQGGRTVFEESFRFVQEPADHRVVSFEWTPVGVSGVEEAVLTAILRHDGQPVHELVVPYRIYSGAMKTSPAGVARSAVFVGSGADYEALSPLVPGCRRIGPDELAVLSPETLVVVGSKLEDRDGGLEAVLKQHVSQGGRVLLLEQISLSLGKLALSRQSFLRAHGADWKHPVLQGLGSDDFMFWHEALHEDGPEPVVRAAFEKPLHGDFTMILECSSGDFGDGGDLWTPLLEYKSGGDMFVANQMEMMPHVGRVPQACLLLRNLLAYAGQAAGAEMPEAAAVSVVATEGRTVISAEAKGVPLTAAWVKPDGKAQAFLEAIRLEHQLVADAAQLVSLPAGSLVIVEAALLKETADEDAVHANSHADGTSTSQTVDALRRFAQSGGKVLVLPALPEDASGLDRLADAAVEVVEHETYHLEAEYACHEVSGMSPVDLFGFDKVHLSPRNVVNKPLALHRLEIPGATELCRSIEGTAWKDFFVGQYAAEYSRLALVEFNRDKTRETGVFLAGLPSGSGQLLFSQLLLDADSAKSIRLYTRLLANLGAAFGDGLLQSVKGDEEWAVESLMALPCPAYVDFAAMKSYYTDPEFSLNNLGEGLYGWMKKKERSPEDGTVLLDNPGGTPWFLSCFVHVPVAGAERVGKLRINANAPCEIYLNGKLEPEPQKRITLQPGVNRLIAIVHSAKEDVQLSLVFLNEDGLYMKDLQYRMTMDEVEPK
jgi:beta-galactosidase